MALRCLVAGDGIGAHAIHAAGGGGRHGTSVARRAGAERVSPPGRLPEQLGWHHHLGFEPGVVLSYGRESRWTGRGGAGKTRVDVLPSWIVRAGNVRTAAEAGLRARIGFGAGDVWTGTGAARGVSGWMEGAARQEAVLRDLFIDGNTFADRAPGLERRTWVAQGEAAFGIRWRRTELEYRHVLRGREYQTQQEPHPYGSIRIRVYR